MRQLALFDISPFFKCTGITLVHLKHHPTQSEWIQRPLFTLLTTIPDDDIYLIEARWHDYGFKVIDKTPHYLWFDGRWLRLYPMSQTDIIWGKRQAQDKFYRLFERKMQRIA